MNATRRNDDLTRCDCFPFTRALGENSGHAPAVEQNTQHARLTQNFEIRPRPRFGGEIAARAGGALVVLAERRLEKAVVVRTATCAANRAAAAARQLAVLHAPHRRSADGARRAVARECLRRIEASGQHRHARTERPRAHPAGVIVKQIAAAAARKAGRKPVTRHDVVLGGCRDARARLERHREMQLRVILIVAPDATPVGNHGDTELAQILTRPDARAQQYGRRMNATRRNDDLTRCDCFPFTRALGENSGHAPAVEQNTQHARLTQNFEFGRALVSAVR